MKFESEDLTQVHKILEDIRKKLDELGLGEPTRAVYDDAVLFSTPVEKVKEEDLEDKFPWNIGFGTISDTSVGISGSHIMNIEIDQEGRVSSYEFSLDILNEAKEHDEVEVALGDLKKYLDGLK